MLALAPLVFTVVIANCGQDCPPFCAQRWAPYKTGVKSRSERHTFYRQTTKDNVVGSTITVNNVAAYKYSVHVIALSECTKLCRTLVIHISSHNDIAWGRTQSASGALS